MAERQRGLGRGLSALLGEATAEAVEAATGHADQVAARAGGVRTVPIELIERNPDQPRRLFTDAEIDALSSSIREKGVLQPILVRPLDEARFQIVAGERRWRASQKAGLREMPVLVRQLDDLEVLEVAIVENVQRADLTPIEEAQGYRALMDRFGRTQDAVAQVVGKSRSHIANALRLLNLPDAVQAMLEDGRLTAGHARAIAAAPGAQELAEFIVAGGLSVRQAEALARKAGQGVASPRSPRTGPSRGVSNADVQAIERDLGDVLGMPVSLTDRGGKGELAVRYGTLEQLDDLLRRLMRG